MNILLIRPKPHKDTIGLQHVMICEPLELEYLAGNISRNDVNVEIVDMIIEKKPLKYFIKKYSPDIVALTGYITHVNIIKEYSETIKKIDLNITTIVGGVHAEVVGEDFDSPYIDYVVKSNPIESFNDIIENKSKGIVDKRFLIEADKNHFNYKFPDRSKVEKYKSKYYYMFHNPCALIKTSYGCPYSCSFCFCKEITGGKYFERSVESVMQEFKTIKEKEIYIVDDDFLFSRERLNRFCDALKENNIDKNFLVYGRADFIAQNEDIICRLASCGLKAVIVGLESFREMDLDKYNKKTSIQENEKTVNILKKHEIELYATLILPMDFTKNDFSELGNWIRSMDITFVNLQPLTPLPGTEIFKIYEKDLIIKREAYEKWDLAHLALRPEHMSIRSYYFQIIKLYYKIVMSPRSIRKMIRKYGIFPVVRLSKGSFAVTMQYVAKLIKG
jgi:radical SAM superfamily enzyme YgiQ (UPF0313 family)